MDFLQEQILIYTSEKNQDIYQHLREDYDIKYHELFTICATIGHKNNRQEKIEQRGREFRSNYFNVNQRSIMYSIIISDNELGKNIEEFDNRDFRLKSKKMIEEYAEGGLEILIEEVFQSRWDGYKLDRNYQEYDIDVMSYIYMKEQEVPF